MALSARLVDGHGLVHGLRRAQPLLGTLVTVQLEPLFVNDGQRSNDQAVVASRLQAATAAAFAAVAHVGRVMSAHCSSSDLGRLARIKAGNAEPISLDPHTVCVLHAAQHWHRLSAGAFDPATAARTLTAAGLRPAFALANFELNAGAAQRLGRLRFIGIDQVLTDGPLALDLGGIAKGYAVDLAVETLQQHGLVSGLVNAGGDLRAFGPRRWPIGVVQRGAARARTDGPHTLCNAAFATSETGWPGSELIPTARLGSWRQTRRGPSNRGGIARCCTVQAPDCMSADALTKWALQADSRAASVRLARVLRSTRATLWRSA